MKRGITTFIKQNIAPKGATKIIMYDKNNEPVCKIPLGHLNMPYTGGKLYSFLGLSDVHQQYDTAPADHQRALTFANNSSEIDFVVEVGDLTSSGTESQLREWKTCVDTYLPNKPLYAIPGNHENYSFYMDDFDISDYTGHPLYYSFTRGDDVFIMVGHHTWYGGDGNVEIIGEAISDEEIQWVYETLEANRNKRCFVFFHVFPWGDCGNANGIYTANMFRGTKCEVFVSLLRHYKNVILFHGHSHLRYYLQEIDEKANYSEANGYKSVHVSSLAVPRDINSAGNGYDTLYAESEGYIIDVYENGIYLQGMNFLEQKLIPIACYWIDTPLVNVPANSYTDSTGTITT